METHGDSLYRNDPGFPFILHRLRQFFFMFPRLSILIGSLFAACVSMKGTNAELGTADVFTLLDSIHVATLAYIFFGILCTIASREMFHRHVAEKKILFWNIIIGVASLGIYTAVNAALIWSAIHS